ncbi:MAG: hypothetical protein EOM19_05985 [Candidatus Moranbacteria bacterium]|nr:hypothetical protein [Candidatus Moranbacteria bacterium]
MKNHITLSKSQTLSRFTQLAFSGEMLFFLENKETKNNKIHEIILFCGYKILEIDIFRGFLYSLEENNV